MELPVYVKGLTVLAKVALEELGEDPSTLRYKTTDDPRGYRLGDLIILGWGGCYVSQKNGKRAAHWRCWFTGGSAVGLVVLPAGNSEGWYT